MRRTLLLSLFTLCLALPASAQKPGEARLGIEIVQAGLFRATSTQEHDRRSGIAHFSVKEEFIRPTREILGRLGVNFGVRFRVTGRPEGATVPVTATIVFPAPGLRPPGQDAPVQRTDLEMTTRVGDRSPTYRGFGFDEPWEIVPGTWRFEFRIGDELLAAHDFTVKAE